MKTRLIIATVLLACLTVISCKKDEGSSLNNVSRSYTDVRDSVYYIAKELYLWTDQLPNLQTFNPISFASPEAVLEKVRTYSPLGTSGKNVDRWSFAIPKAEWDKVSTGVSGDFGCGFSFASSTDLRISFAYARSSAGMAGVQRGWRVLSLNSTEATTANSAALNTALQGTNLDVAFEKPDGSKVTLRLTRGSYQTNPVLKRSIITQGSKKIGYIAFNSFLGSTASSEIDEAFAFFKANGVSDLIFDERYNGGGYVSLSEKIANLIVPKVNEGQLMYKDAHNTKYASWNKTKYFANPLPASNLNLSRVVFIATERTASASELLINVLYPYTEVKIIGKNTYGKPAGYYAFPVMTHYSLPLAVKQVNAAGSGDFYEGLKADKIQIDDLTRDFGDPNEACTKDALAFFATGKMARSAATGGRTEALDAPNALLDKQPKLSIHERP